MSFLAGLARRGPATTSSFTRAFSASARRDIARITVVGNLAATPEVRATSTGRDLIEYSVASNSGGKDNRTTSWFKVVSFAEEGPRREFITSLPKGATVYVEGDATQNTYVDSEGKSRSRLSIYQTKLDVLKRPTPESAE
ncbi:nucleic acid-binding protein [Whalleya microplaca]|nr:nucleic acid-binding protein [Whalleya microplaca]